MRRGLLSLSLAAMLIASFASTAFAGDVFLGILPRLHPTELKEMFTPLAEYLSRETGEKVSLMIPKDFDAFKAAVEAGQMDYAFANPLIYVQLKKKIQAIDALALAEEAKGGAKFRGIFITRTDSGLSNVSSLKGKKLIFVDEDSAAGYIFQVLSLKKEGIDIKKDVTVLPFAKKHDNVTLTVFRKDADAGGIREGDLDKMKDIVDLSQIKILGYTDYYPNWPIFATQKANPAVSAKIKAAMLKLRSGSAEAQKTLGAAKLNGFLEVKDTDYDQLREAASVAGAL